MAATHSATAARRRSRGDSTEALEIDFVIQQLANAKLQIAELSNQIQRLQHKNKQLERNALLPPPSSRNASFPSTPPPPRSANSFPSTPSPPRSASSSPNQMHSMEDLEQSLVEERVRAAESEFLHIQLQSESKDLKKQLQKMKQHNLQQQQQQQQQQRRRQQNSPPPPPPSLSPPAAAAPPSAPAAAAKLKQGSHLRSKQIYQRALQAPVRTHNVSSKMLPSFVFERLCCIPVCTFLSLEEVLSSVGMLCKRLRILTLTPTFDDWHGRTRLWSHFIALQSQTEMFNPRHRVSLWLQATTGHTTPTAAMMSEYQALLEKSRQFSSVSGGGGGGSGGGGGGGGGSSQGERSTSLDQIAIEADVGRTFVKPNRHDSPSGSGSPGSGGSPGGGSGSVSPSITSLRNVLLAYSQHSSSVGYCQGMNFFVGMLLQGFVMAATSTPSLQVPLPTILLTNKDRDKDDDKDEDEQQEQEHEQEQEIQRRRDMFIESAALFTFLGVMAPLSRWGGHELFGHGLTRVRTVMNVHDKLVSSLSRLFQF